LHGDGVHSSFGREPHPLNSASFFMAFKRGNASRKTGGSHQDPTDRRDRPDHHLSAHLYHHHELAITYLNFQPIQPPNCCSYCHQRKGRTKDKEGRRGRSDGNPRGGCASRRGPPVVREIRRLHSKSPQRGESGLTVGPPGSFQSASAGHRSFLKQERGGGCGSHSRKRFTRAGSGV
jgi:hypothetical protein